MELAGYVVNAVIVERRGVAEVAAEHDISKSWLYELLARYREGGEESLKPRSRQPHRSPTKVSPAIEDEIVALRKSLAARGFDARPSTIQYHLAKRRRRSRTKAVPSVATIWRCLLGGGSSFRSPRNSDHATPGGDSRPICQTSSGKPIRPMSLSLVTATLRF